MPRLDQYQLEALESRVLLDASPVAAAVESVQSTAPQAVLVEAPSPNDSEADHAAAQQSLWGDPGDLTPLESLPSVDTPSVETMESSEPPTDLHALGLGLGAPDRPLLVFHGIGGSMPTDSNYLNWVMNRGFEPNRLLMDPVKGYYNGLMQTLELNGYDEGKDLWGATYDWRVPPGPTDGVYDGVVHNEPGSRLQTLNGNDLTARQITDTQYDFGVDALGYWLVQASLQWARDHAGVLPSDVDVIAHSTGGLVVRAYIQSAAYGGELTVRDTGTALILPGGQILPAGVKNPDGTPVTTSIHLPTINRLITFGVPMRGAPGPYLLAQDDWGNDTSYEYLSKIVTRAYVNYQSGMDINGPNGTTIEGFHEGDQPLDPKEFIALYCPTFRSLTATYNFIDDSTLAAGFNDSADANRLVIDLNDGLDYYYTESDIQDDGTAFDGTSIYRPSGFVSSIAGSVTVIYNAGVPTSTTLFLHNGPSHFNQNADRAGDFGVTPFWVNDQMAPGANEVWYTEDVAEGVSQDSTRGDSSVPERSAIGIYRGIGTHNLGIQFDGSRVTLVQLTNPEATHTGMLLQEDGLRAALAALGFDATAPVRLAREFTGLSLATNYLGSDATLTTVPFRHDSAQSPQPRPLPVRDLRAHATGSLPTLDATQLAQFADVLEALSANVLDGLTSAAELAEEIPFFIGTTVDVAIDVLSGQLVSLLVSTADAVRSLPAFSTVEALAEVLIDSGVLADGIAVKLGETWVDIAIDLTTVLTQEILSSLGDASAAAGELAASLINEAVAAQNFLQMQARIRIDFAPSDPAEAVGVTEYSGVAALTAQETDASGNIQLGSEPPSSYDGSAIDVEAYVTQTLVDDSPDDGVVTVSEMSSRPGADQSVIQKHGRGRMAIRTDTADERVVYATSDQPFERDPDVFIDSINFELIKEKFSQVLDQLALLGDAIEDPYVQAALHIPLPFLDDPENDTLDELLTEDTTGFGLDEFFAIVDILRQYCDQVQQPNLADFLDRVMDYFRNSGGDGPYAHGPFSITGGFDATGFGFNLIFKAELARSQDLLLTEEGLGAEADVLGLDLSIPATGTVSFSTEFSIGMDLHGLLATPSTGLSTNQVTLDFNKLALGFDLDVPDIDASFSLGFLQASIVDGTASMHLDLNVAINGNNPVSLTQLQSAPGSPWLSFTPAPTATLNVRLPVIASVGGTSLTDGCSPVITITDANLFDSQAPQVATTDFDCLSGFCSITPAQALAMLKSLGDWLDQFRDSEVFNVTVPFTSGTTLGEIFDVSKAFTDKVYNQLAVREIAAAGAQSETVSTQGRLSGDATFELTLDNGPPVVVTVPYSETSTNETLQDLVADFNVALSTAGLAASVEAAINGSGRFSIRLKKESTVKSMKLTVLDPDDSSSTPNDDPMISELGLSETQYTIETADFSNISEFSDDLSNALASAGIPLNVNLRWDPVTQEARMDVSYSSTVNQSVSFNFDPDLGLGPLLDASASGTITLNAGLDAGFTLGFDMSPKDTPRIQTSGLVPPPSTGKITADAAFTLKLGSDRYDLTLTAAATSGNSSLADLATDLNTVFTSAGISDRVAAEVSSNTIVLKVPDAKLGAVESIQVLGLEESTFFTEVGFVNGDADCGTSVGLFVENMVLEGSLTISASDLEASLRVGVFSISVSDGYATGTGEFHVAIQAPDGTGRFDLDDLFAAAPDFGGLFNVAPTLNASIDIHLPNLEIKPDLFDILAAEEIRIYVPDIHFPEYNPEPFDAALNSHGLFVTLPAFGGLSNFNCLSYLDILQNLSTLADQLADLQGFGFLDKNIPLLNLSISDILDYAGNIASMVEDLATGNADTIETLERDIENFLNVSDRRLIDLTVEDYTPAPLERSGSGPAVTAFNPSGASNAIRFESKSNHSAYEGTVVEFVDDGRFSGTADDASIEWSESDKRLRIYYHAGSTTANTVVTRIKAKLDSPIDANIDSAVESGGTGTITVTALKFSLHYNLAYGSFHSLDLGLDDLLEMLDPNDPVIAALGGVSSIVQLEANGSLNVTANADLLIEFGIDVSNPCAWVPFLYDTTSLTLSAAIRGTDIDFTASLGALGVYGKDGSVTVDRDGDPTTTGDGEDATFSVSITDNDLDGRHYFRDGLSFLADIDIDLEAGAGAEITLCFPTPDIPLGTTDDTDGNGFPDNTLVLRIPDLSTLFDFGKKFVSIGGGQFQVVLPSLGPNNDLKIATFDPAIAGLKVRAVKLTSGVPRIEITADSLLIYLDAGVTNLSALFALSTPQFTLSASLETEGGANDGSGKVSSSVDLSMPNLSSFLGAFNACDLITNAPLLLDGLDAILGVIQDGLQSEVFSRNLPLVGTQLAKAGDFIEDFREGMLADIREKLATAGDPLQLVREAIWSALGKPGLNLLDASIGSADDISVECQIGADGQMEILFDLMLGKTISLVDTSSDPIDIDLGIPGLGLDINGNVTVEVGWSFHFSFGISASEGFFLNTKLNDPELQVFFNASIPGLELTGNLFFLELKASDEADGIDANGNPRATTSFNGEFSIDLVDPAELGDPDGDGRVSFGEMVGGGFSIPDFFVVSLDACAEVHLDLEVSFGEDARFPRLLVEFDLTWCWDPLDGEGSTGDLEFGFHNLQIDLGQFISKFIIPILDEIQTVTKPLDPIIDILTARLPIFSDLAGEPLNLLDLAEAAGLLKPGTVQFIESLGTIADLVNQFSVFNGKTILINLGGFDLDQDPFGNIDPFAPLSKYEIKPEEMTTDGDAKGFLNSLKELGFTFPFLSLSELFNLLTGKPVSLVEYHMPVLEFEAKLSGKIPIFPPLYIIFGGQIGAKIDLTFGFDTTGIQKYAASTDKNIADLFEGFYIKDVDDYGNEITELQITGGLFAGAAIDLLIAEVGVTGGIFAEINFDLRDLDGDGRVRAAEIVANAKEDPLCIFEVAGRLYVALDAFLEVHLLILDVDKEWRFGEITLLEFGIDCPVPVLASFDTNGDGTESETEQTAGVLVLHQGEYAALRKYGDTNDGDEYFTVRGATDLSGGSQSVEVSFGGYKQIYPGVKSILAKAGKGDDTVDLTGVLVPAEVHGGDGDDVIQATRAGGTYYGDAGNDTVTAEEASDDFGGGAETFYGGAGNDLLTGFEGNDFLYGEDGDDELYGGDGSDTIEGGAGNDAIWGEAGGDTLSGDDGADILIGDDGEDDLKGGDGDDTLTGGNDDDELTGGDDDDSLDGGAGDDVLVGDNGTIVSLLKITGISGDGNDVLAGGAGNDTLIGAGGNDALYGGNHLTSGITSAVGVSYKLVGTEMVSESDGADFLDGGEGDDVIVADDGHSGQSSTFPGAEVGDLVWLDLNENGIQDAGEPGLSGVRVDLYRSSDNARVAYAVTDASGAFRIAGLGAGDYYLQIEAPSGTSFTAESAAEATSEADSDFAGASGATTAVTDTFHLDAGEKRTDLDAGLIGGTPTVSISDASVQEGDTGVTSLVFTVALSSASSQVVTVNYQTGSDSDSATHDALAGYDYGSTAYTLVFAPGELTKEILVPVYGDQKDELNETVQVTLADAFEYITPLTIADDKASGTIIDDDEAPVASITDSSVEEEVDGTAASLTFTVTLSNASWQTLKIEWLLRQVTNPDGSLATDAAVVSADYTDASGTLTFNEDVVTRSFSVSVKGDLLDEYDEELLAIISVSSTTAADAVSIDDDTAIGTIVDNDATPYVTIRNPSALPFTEGHAGNKPVPLQLGLSAVSGRAVTVSWNTSRGTAIDSPSLTETTDFLDSFETITFAPGETSKTVNAYIVGDTVVEGLEFFFANLLTALNAEIGTTSANPNHAVIRISDDESGDQGPWYVQFSDASYSVTEGGTATITLVRAGDSSYPVAVYWIAGGTATAGEDYNPEFDPGAGGDRGLVRFGPGETIKTFSIATYDNRNSDGESLYEGDETILLQLANPQGGPVRGLIKSATLTIVEDDPLPIITISDAAGAAHLALENNPGPGGSLVFTVSITGATTQEIKVDFSSISGSATAESDFTSKSGTLTFNASTNYLPQTISIQVKPDDLVEDYEDLFVVLSNPVNATLGDYLFDSDATGGEDSDDRGYGLIMDLDAASASGRVFFDANANGYRDSATDYGYQGVTITWTSVLDATATYSDTTDAEGLYSLELPLGDYSVTIEEADLPSGATSTSYVLPYTVSFGASGMTLDFGYSLPSATEQPSTSSGSSTTGSNDTAYGGAGSDTLDGGAGDDRLVGGHWLGPGCSCDGNAYDVDLVETRSGTVRTLIDIDSSKLPPLGSIGGRVWIDSNGDNTENSGSGTEAGLPNVQVNLYDSDWVLVATAYTDASGNYSFGNLVACDYQVQVLPPGGYAVVTKGAGTQARNSDVDTATGLTTAISVAGAPVSDIDAGVRVQPAGTAPWNVSFAQAIYSVRESDGFALISLSGSGDALHPVAVYYTQDGTASAGEDYTGIRSVLRVDRGTTTAYFLVPIVADDNDGESYETVLLFLQNPQGGPVHGIQPAAVLLIFDNPCPDDDHIDGGEGNDRLMGDFGYFAGDGSAVLLGGMGNDALNGAAGDDLLYAEGGNDTLEGGTGNDLLDGGSENDLYVFDTDEVLGSDDIAEGSAPLGGADTLDFSTTALSVVIDLNDTTLELSNNGSTVLSLHFPATFIENVNGGSGNDTLLGSDSDNILRGNGGRDTLEGRGGNDDLDGGSGDDTYRFNADTPLGSDDIFEAANRDSDTIDFADTTVQAVSLNLATSASQVVAPTLTLTISTTPVQTVIGSFHVTLIPYNPFTGEAVASDVSTGIENLYGSSTAPGSGAQDVLTGNTRDNIIWGREGNDLLDGGSAGYDILREERAGNWQLTATTLTNATTGESDTFSTGTFDEISLTGDDSPNQLDASTFSGLVRLNGAGGDDTLIGGSGTNYLTGGAGRDTINGSLGYDIVTESQDADMTLTPTSLQIGSETDTFIGLIEEVELSGGDSDNTLNASAFAGVAKLHGGGGTDLIFGGTGNDVLEGGPGDDILAGGFGDDAYVFDADDVLGLDHLTEMPGEGRDLLDFSTTQTAGVNVNLGLSTAQTINSNLQIQLSSSVDFEDLRGGLSDDTLIGNDMENVIEGLDGSDRITGGLANDELIGGDGSNATGVTFTDTLVEQRNALLTSLSGTTLSFGGAIEDTLAGFERAELTGGFGPNRIDTTPFPGAVVLDGGDGNDTLIGGTFDDQLTGGPGNDDLRGGLGNDTYLFDADSPLGSDTLGDTDGVDWIDLSGTATLTNNVSLLSTAGQTINANLTLTLAGGDQIENLRGGSLGDTLTGNNLDNTIEGGFGDDRITGLEGDDLLIGGDGNDTYVFDLLTTGSLGTDTVLEDVGAGGVDTLEFNGTSTVSATVSLALGAEQTVHASLKLLLIRSSSVENVIGTPGADNITGNSLDNRIEGRGGDDVLAGALGNDTYVFDADSALGSDTLTEDPVEGGTDTLDFSATSTGIGSATTPLGLGVATAQTVNSFLTLTLGSTSAFEDVTGGSGDDFINGNELNNVLVGAAGNDTLNGRVGSDLLEGGVGSDNLSGGRGDDQYVFTDTATGNDILTESTSEGTDTIDFSQVATHALTFSLNASTAQTLWTGLTITLSATDTFENVAGGALDDVLTGNNQANAIAGGPGKDRLAGRGGADSLAGGADDDTYEFGTSPGDDLIAELPDEGVDTLDFAATGQGLTVAWNETAQITVVDFSGDTHTISHFSDQVEKLIGTNAADLVVVTPSATTAFDFTGGAGNDTLTYITGGGPAVQTVGQIDLAGYMPVTLRGFETVTLLEEEP